jgi:hypothetical protein
MRERIKYPEKERAAMPVPGVCDIWFKGVMGYAVSYILPLIGLYQRVRPASAHESRPERFLIIYSVDDIGDQAVHRIIKFLLITFYHSFRIIRSILHVFYAFFNVPHNRLLWNQAR